MQTPFIFANWKAHKTAVEATEWLQALADLNTSSLLAEKEVVVFPPFHLLSLVKETMSQKNLAMKIGVQDVSSFSEGAYTGEVSATQAKEFVSYAIIGHSERRTYLHESEEMLLEKVAQAQAAGLEIIYCVRSEADHIPTGIVLVAFEPVNAIGTGKPDSPEEANAMAGMIKSRNSSVKQVIYGGSVTADNVHSFTSQPSLAGVLVGSASLDPHSFHGIIANS